MRTVLEETHEPLVIYRGSISVQALWNSHQKLKSLRICLSPSRVTKHF